ncbi:MAG: hypothetical protein U9R44_06485 [Candidatus Omnitrophota bacterium]|nr:hypothetical protein [Candidatus Omnitrophota bacterium]
MKKVLAVLTTVLFCVSAVSAFAADTSKGSTHRPASKDIDTPTFQGASDHISNWGKSSEIVKGESLREDADVLVKRRGPDCEKYLMQ